MLFALCHYFWRLIPGNPILLRVVAMGSKRKRDLFIRCGYLGLLVFLVFFLLFSGGSVSGAPSLTALSKSSTEIFRQMSYVQLALVALLAPIFTAGAITQEKDNQTYDILLSTPLTNGQIVLGSLLSRLFFVVALLISGMPVFAITRIFGGVSIENVVYSFLIAAATAFITGATATAIAVFKVGTRRTIFSFYLFIGLFLAIPLLIEQLGYLRVAGDAPGSHISWLAGIHPFLALRVIFHESGYGPPAAGSPTVAGLPWPLSWYLTSPHTFYISFMFILSFVLVTPSIVVLRRMAQSSTTLRSWILQKLRLSSGDKTRRPRHVWTNPIAWREAKTKASAARAVLLRYGFMLAGIAGAIVLLVLYATPLEADKVVSSAFNEQYRTLAVRQGDEITTYTLARSAVVKVNDRSQSPESISRGMTVVDLVPDSTGRAIKAISVIDPQPRMALGKVRGFLLGAVIVEFAVILLMITQSAASTVTREKEDGTLDLLLATPITSRYYIWGKLRGLVSFVMPLVAVPVFSVLLFVFWDVFAAIFSENPPRQWAIYPEAVLVLPGTIILVAAFAAILGMHMSLRCRRTVMAVMSSVGIVAGVCFMLGMCGMGVVANAAEPGLIIGSFSPFTLVALLLDPENPTLSHRSGDVGLNRMLVVLFGWAATAAYAAVVWAMYKSMVRNFDMTIRKQAE